MRRIPMPINRDDRVRAIDESTLQAVFDAAKTTRHPKHDTAMLAVLLDAGLRASELCNLRMRDVDLMQGALMVEHGKGGKARMAPLGKAAAKAVWDYLRNDQERGPDDPLFETERGEAFTRTSLRQLFDRLSEKVGVHIHPHQLRHTAGVSMLRNGASAYHVMRFLGHTTLTMTQRYTKLLDQDVRDIHRSTSPLDNLKRNRRAK